MTESQFYTLLNASNVEDVLRHFPSRYEDLNVTELNEPFLDGKRYVVKGIVKDLRSLNNRYSSIIRFKCHTFSGKVLSCLLVNQSFYMNIIANNTEKLLVLYYSETRKCFIVNSITNIDSYFALTGIRPIYSLPKGISQSYFISYLKKILTNSSYSKYIKSKVPTLYQNKYHLLNDYEAFKLVHLPKDEKSLYQGLRVFKYEEALAYSIRSLLIKKENEKKKKDVLKIDHNKINDFIKNLSFKLTNSQNKCIKEIILDLESEKVMYRLLQGDVGSGKTIVSFISLYGNYLRGKQGVLLSPTFELAYQHYQNALKVFKDYNLNIKFLYGNIKTKEKKEMLEQLKTNQIDILISTHSVLTDDVIFSNLGLTIIDEQQLFGVKQRETILNKSTTCDLLMMSATPIPRTLSQIINIDIDVSTIDELPYGNKNICTVVTNTSDPIIDKAIRKCLEKGRQIFVIVPKIEEGDNKIKSVEDLYEEYSLRYNIDNISCLNGKIKKEERDKIFLDFTTGKKKILISTTVIEVGIDVKKAGLLIVYNANYFGLSSLHQLRGRIGRSGDFALAILLYDGNDSKAKEKLKFLSENNDGMKISQYDLKMRGTGSYEGEKQSGKSELQVCNFVDDYNIFIESKKDASEILSNLNDKENEEFLKYLNLDKKSFIV